MEASTVSAPLAGTASVIGAGPGALEAPVDAFEVHVNAFALRPVRVDEKNNCFLNYEATTFPKDPWGGCRLYLNRCRALGYLRPTMPDANYATIDVLAENGDIVQEFLISRTGFRYLRRVLKFRREREE